MTAWVETTSQEASTKTEAARNCLWQITAPSNKAKRHKETAISKCRNSSRILIFYSSLGKLMNTAYLQDIERS